MALRQLTHCQTALHCFHSKYASLQFILLVCLHPLIIFFILSHLCQLLKQFVMLSIRIYFNCHETAVRVSNLLKHCFLCGCFLADCYLNWVAKACTVLLCFCQCLTSFRECLLTTGPFGSSLFLSTSFADGPFL